MALGSESTAEEEEATPTRGSLCVHAYGRLEEVGVQPTLAALREAAREAFDLPDTEILLKGPDGQCLAPEGAPEISSVYLELQGNGLFDLEQRIDQLQHLQVSYISDRLGTLAEEQVACQASIAGLTDALIEEQAFRQEFEDAVRAEIKHECDGVALQSKRRLEQLEQRLREQVDEALQRLEERLTRDLQDLWQWTSDECRQHRDRLEGLEPRVHSFGAAAREALEFSQGLQSASQGPVKECLDAQARLSARVDDLCDTLVKEVQERMAESRRFQEELSHRDERTESLRDFGQELHAAMAHLRASPEAEKRDRDRDPLERAVGELSRQMDEWREEQGHLRRQLQEESDMRTEAQSRLARGMSLLEQAFQELQAEVKGADDPVKSSASEEKAAASSPGHQTDGDPEILEVVRQVREECFEAIQREVRSRLQDAAKLRQALEMESKSRKEAFGMIQRAVSQCGS
ncbi:unnamed protein product [Effrenium voratum]|uniref:Uncharacterized protein n=1 Tax=Effrenium voratum TaxID=2562239 RepID=A0AA36HU30_9DINO|nr:unnamed protein product [Effrenium voratum]CAJ1428382.1 unnamed protein product [Effrenium voratum]